LPETHKQLTFWSITLPFILKFLSYAKHVIEIELLLCEIWRSTRGRMNWNILRPAASDCSQRLQTPVLPQTSASITWCFSDRASWIIYILITNLMHRLLFTHAVYRLATMSSRREWQYHMLHVYNCILLKMSTYSSKHVAE